MERSVNSSLKESKVRLNGIRRHVSSHELSLVMLDGLMSAFEVFTDSDVGRPLVGHNAGIFVAEIPDRSFKSLGVNVLDRLREDVSFSLDES